MRALAILAVLVLAPLTDALAQELPLRPGRRVRVTAPTIGIKKQAATFDALRGDMLVVVADSTMDFPLASVTRLDVYAGRQGHARRGAGIGFLAGVSVGGVIGYFYCTAGTGDCLDSSSDQGAELQLIGPLAIGAVAGTLLGAAVGALIKTDKWEQVPLDRLRVSVVPTRSGFGIGASFAF